MIAVSIVSHGHGEMVQRLVVQLLSCPEVTRIILTLNVPEEFTFCDGSAIEIIRNPQPKGFAANHNAAFLHCREPYFCVLNPDIELIGNPMPGLLSCLNETGAAMSAPLVVSPSGQIEDSIRYFPTLGTLVKKAMGGHDGRYNVYQNASCLFPEWVAGMFMLFSTPCFTALKGFDEGYFLYYEDVDICKRIWQAGMRVVACPTVSVVHGARRDSHRSLRHMRWHLASMARYLLKYR